MREANRNPEEGQIYHHFKGNRYFVLAVSTDTETGEELVTYRLAAGEQSWTQALSRWNEEVEAGSSTKVKRFTLVTETGDDGHNNIESGDGADPDNKFEDYKYKEIVRARFFEESDLKNFRGKPFEDYLVEFTDPEGHKDTEIIPKEIFENLYEKVMPF